jgi:hypothetical protein
MSFLMAPSEDAAADGWTSYVHALVGLNEFLFVD